MTNLGARRGALLFRADDNVVRPEMECLFLLSLLVLLKTPRQYLFLVLGEGLWVSPQPSFLLDRPPLRFLGGFLLLLHAMRHT